MSVSVSVYRRPDLATTLWTWQPRQRFVRYWLARSRGLKCTSSRKCALSRRRLRQHVRELDLMENEELNMKIVVCWNFAPHTFHPIRSDSCGAITNAIPLTSLHTHTQMHTCKSTQTSRQTDTRSFVHLLAEKLNRWRLLLSAWCRSWWQWLAVGGTALIIPQNPSQMSLSLGGRWARAPLCRTAMVLAALQTCWV